MMTSNLFFAQNRTVERYTPRYIWERCIKVMGRIDCDPCADRAKHIPAKVHYTKEDDGLAREHPFGVTTYMNPPFGRNVISFFLKLENELKNGNTREFIVLWKNASETDAYQIISRITDLICFPSARITFDSGIDHTQGHSTFSPVLFYHGPHKTKFTRQFYTLGNIWKPHKINQNLKVIQFINPSSKIKEEDRESSNADIGRWLI